MSFEYNVHAWPSHMPSLVAQNPPAPAPPHMMMMTGSGYNMPYGMHPMHHIPVTQWMMPSLSQQPSHNAMPTPLMNASGSNNAVGITRSTSPPASTASLFTLRNGVSSLSVQAVAFGDGKLASTGDNTVAIWGLSDWRIIRTMSGRRGSRYESLAWDPKQMSVRLATLSPSDRSLKLWDLRAKAEQQTELQLNMDGVNTLTWNPEGNTIILGSQGALGVYDLRQSRIAVTRKLDFSVNSPCFIGPFLAVGTERGTLELLDPSTLSTRASLKAHVAELSSIATNPKRESHIATGGNDGIVQLWDMDGNAMEGDVDILCCASVDARSKIRSLAFSGNGKYIASSSTNEKSIDVSLAQGGELVLTIPNEDFVRMIAFSRADTDPAFLAFCIDNSRDIFVQPISAVEESVPALRAKSS